MAKIVINEVDNTTPGVAAQSNEIVFIPGFLGLPGETGSVPTGVKGECYHITTLAEFKTIIGTIPLPFKNKVTYTDDAGSSTFIDGTAETKGVPDPSFLMAKEYLQAGLAIQYYVIDVQGGGSTPTGAVPSEYTTLSAILAPLLGDEGALIPIEDSFMSNSLADVGNYSMKYITTGGYPTVFKADENSTASTTYGKALIAFAKARGDSIAIVDHSDQFSLDPSSGNSVYSVCKPAYGTAPFATDGDYGTMITSPWNTYTLVASGGTIKAPGGFVYLMSLADSIQTNEPWLAIAGVTRGLVRNLTGDSNKFYTNGAADYMQPRNATAINGVTNIRPYGACIWGNRTLKSNGEGNLTATSFLNIRNLVCDIKKLCYQVARSCTFEQNNDILWVNFRSKLVPTLDRMKTGYGISGYSIVRDLEHEKAAEKATLCAKIILYPVYAVEDFYITIVLNDEEVTVE